LLKSETASNWLAEAIEKARVEHDFALIAYVFMPNHAHLIIRPSDQEYDVGAIRKSIKQPVAQKAIAKLRRSNSEMLARLKTASGKRIILSFLAGWWWLRPRPFYSQGNFLRHSLHPCKPSEEEVGRL
jgi:putative transposase